MITSLILKECKQMACSLTYVICVAVFLIFQVSQLGETKILTEPKPNQESYGVEYTSDKSIIRENTLQKLEKEINWNSFTTYPIGFYKKIVLSSQELEDVKKILEDCRKDADYQYFASQMNKVSEMIGKGSSYEQDNYETKTEAPRTYEQALKGYRAICIIDGVTDAYMRLFCDYAVILMSFLAVFVGVTRCVRDKRVNAEQVIYTKRASSAVIIFSRYAANAVMLLLPIVILALIFQAPYMYQASTVGVKPHYFAFLFYSVVWILPTIMFMLSLAFLLTELSNGIVAIMLQICWAFISLFCDFDLVGNFGMKLIPRWNSLGQTYLYVSEKTYLYQNRIIYTILSLILILGTIFIYDIKRKGGLKPYEKKH